jgi:hypothetical protein
MRLGQLMVNLALAEHQDAGRMPELFYLEGDELGAILDRLGFDLGD